MNTCKKNIDLTGGCQDVSWPERIGYIPSRTCAAFDFTCERLFKRCKQVYFWTFTFKSVPLTDDFAMEDWATLRKRLVKKFPSLIGVRVCELHRSHGIHFHVLLSEPVPIHCLRQMMYGSGRVIGRNRYLDFGRLSVSRCDVGTAQYLAKYLRKSYVRTHWFGRRRRWGIVGGGRQTGWQACRCKDVIYDTAFHRNMKELGHGRQMSPGLCLLLSHYSNVWGEVESWPEDIRRAMQELILNYAGRCVPSEFKPHRGETDGCKKRGVTL